MQDQNQLHPHPDSLKVILAVDAYFKTSRTFLDINARRCEIIGSRPSS